MKRIMLHKNEWFFFAALALMFSSACKKNKEVPNTAVAITSISPASGNFDIYDTIYGHGFGNDINSIEVFFNATSSSVISVSDSQVVTVVPKGCGSGYVNLKKNSDQVRGPSFTYIYKVNVTTVAGLGYPGLRNGSVDEALFSYPRGIAMDSDENIYVADFGNNCIRKISRDGVVSTVAGNGTAGYRDGPAPDAEFYSLYGLSIDKSGTLYISDGTRIRKLSNNIVSTVAGSDIHGHSDGEGLNASFDVPFGLVTDASGNLFISDANNNSIRMMKNGTVTTIAGSTPGYLDADGVDARFASPGCIAFAPNSNKLYIADAGNARIRSLAGVVVSTYAGNGNFGYKDGRFFEAEFKFPTGIAADKKGNVYVCGEEDVIRKIDVFGNVTTIAGSGDRGFSDGAGSEAMFNGPIYMFFDNNDMLYVSDISNHAIRKVTIE